MKDAVYRIGQVQIDIDKIGDKWYNAHYSGYIHSYGKDNTISTALMVSGGKDCKTHGVVVYTSNQFYL